MKNKTVLIFLLFTAVNKKCYISKTVKLILTFCTIKAYNYTTVKKIHLLLLCGGDFKCLFL